MAIPRSLSLLLILPSSSGGGEGFAEDPMLLQPGGVPGALGRL